MCRLSASTSPICWLPALYLFRSEVGRLLSTNREIWFRVPSSVFVRDVSCEAAGARVASGVVACLGSVSSCSCCRCCPSCAPVAPLVSRRCPGQFSSLLVHGDPFCLLQLFAIFHVLSILSAALRFRVAASASGFSLPNLLFSHLAGLLGTCCQLADCFRHTNGSDRANEEVVSSSTCSRLHTPHSIAEAAESVQESTVSQPTGLQHG